MQKARQPKRYFDLRCSLDDLEGNFIPFALMFLHGFA